MATNIIVSYDNTENDRDALALGRRLRDAGANISLASVRHIQLTEAEAAFRIQKSDLAIRPIWHQREDRVQAHIFVCFLAYVLWKTLEQWQQRAGLGHSPRTILEELRRVQSTDVVLPTHDGRDLRLRCVVRADPAQARLLDRLGLTLQERLRIRPTAALTAEM